MSIRPLTAAAGGALLGMTALFLTAAPAASAAPAAPALERPHAPLPVAHRGASAYAPENTLAAVDKADELGIDWVENDVQRTKDGELVVMHDTTLARTTNAEEVFPDRAPWNVSDFTAAEIRKLDAGSWFDPEYRGVRVPTLRQYVNRIEQHRQRLLLELKAPELYPGVEKETLRELRRLGWLDRSHVKRKLIIQSFNAASVEKVHDLVPAVKTGFLGNPAASELKKYAAFSDQINPRHAAVTEDYVKAIHAVKGAHGKPLEVFTWTIDDAPTAVRVAEAGVDGIISNKPDVIRDATRGFGSAPGLGG
ncbi:glycerophosphodiester phosphodiesterase family protein [Streptomyces boncukensis]|uniref:Glycerophosphodiester phosphodiesterase n=1 Tax=Streptomyces boncukensis TaxID=2711219 RepID=A0A6G4WZQ7_9ACTN|nr:glycerophosphodiester phosphodiesterase family protein [Streptomyces boncukensis]NGO70779.1 glycerophosphodiester phosphodiesterase [Streptomyces boncukensis]